jgi:hypothetical protein
MMFAWFSQQVRTGVAMEKKEDGLQGNQKTQGVWERRTVDRRWGQNQLFGSFRVDSGVRALPQGDPTDDALAAIASILDQPKDKPADRSVDTPVDQPVDQPVEQAVDKATDNPEIAPAEATPAAPPPVQSVPADLDSYVRRGPGPLDAIRFKWAARPAGDGNYFVDETIGDSSRVMTTGPMPREEAIKVIDERERDARRRFDALKSEMTGPRPSATDRKDAGEM